jgi:hypothetical protein
LQFFEEIFTAFETSAVGDFGFLHSIPHELLPVSISLLETLGLILELSSNILGLHEDGVKFLPVFLDFYPLSYDAINSL